MKRFVQNINLIIENNKLSSFSLINELIKTCENFYIDSTGNEILTINNIIVDQMNKIAERNIQMIAFYKFVKEIISVIQKDYNSSQNIADFFSSYKENSEINLNLIADNISSIVDAKNSKFLLHSSSNCIQHYFSKIANIGISSEIFQTISHPSKEGIKQAKTLASLGHKVFLIEDSAVNKIIDKIDFVMLGANAILTNSFVNKIGTSFLCHASYKSKLPVFVVTDTIKYISENTDNVDVINSLLNEMPKPSEEILMENIDNIYPLNYYFENIPYKLISGFINEKGIFTTNKIKNLIKNLNILDSEI